MAIDTSITPRAAYYGVPESEAHQPNRKDLVDLHNQVLNSVALAGINYHRDTTDEMDAITGMTSGEVAIIYDIAANGGGIYEYDGSDWVLQASLPQVLTETLSSQAAEAAQTAAELAQSLAEAAQTTAEVAQAGAEVAQAGAEVAEDGAAAAQAAAETAQAQAEGIAQAAAYPPFASTAAMELATSNGDWGAIEESAGVRLYENVAGTATGRGWLKMPEFTTVSALAASSLADGDIEAGLIIEAEGLRLEVVSSGEHFSTSGGMKVKAKPTCGAIVGRAFNITGDGVTDDGPALQKAIDNGDPLIFGGNGRGILTNQPIYMPSGAHLVGRNLSRVTGSTVVGEKLGTTLVAGSGLSSGDVLLTAEPSAAEIAGGAVTATGWYIDGISLDVNGQAGVHGFVAYNPYDGCEIGRMSVIGCDQDGVPFAVKRKYYQLNQQLVIGNLKCWRSQATAASTEPVIDLRYMHESQIRQMIAIGNATHGASAGIRLEGNRHLHIGSVASAFATLGFDLQPSVAETAPDSTPLTVQSQVSITVDLATIENISGASIQARGASGNVHAGIQIRDIRYAAGGVGTGPDLEYVTGFSNIAAGGKAVTCGDGCSQVAIYSPSSITKTGTANNIAEIALTGEKWKIEGVGLKTGDIEGGDLQVDDTVLQTLHTGGVYWPSTANGTGTLRDRDMVVVMGSGSTLTTTLPSASKVISGLTYGQSYRVINDSAATKIFQTNGSDTMRVGAATVSSVTLNSGKTGLFSHTGQGVWYVETI